MIMIVSCHAAAHGINQQIEFTYDSFTWQYACSSFLELLGDIGNNVFILLTGYFSTTRKNINSRRLFDVTVDLFFYNWILLPVAVYGFCISVNIKTILVQSLPILTGRNWFVACYILFSFFIPFINTLTDKLDEKSHKRLCFVLLLLYCLRVFKLRTFITVGNYMDRFLVFYLIGSYLHLYGVPKHFKVGMSFYVSWLMLPCYILGLWLLSVKMCNNGIIQNVNALEYFWGSVIAVMTFVFVMEIKDFNSRFINFVATSSMGIFLLSENSVLGTPLWTVIIPLINYSSSAFFLLYFIGFVLIVFSICLVIDKIKQYFFGTVLKNFLDNLYEFVLKIAGRVKNVIDCF